MSLNRIFRYALVPLRLSSTPDYVLKGGAMGTVLRIALGTLIGVVLAASLAQPSLRFGSVTVDGKVWCIVGRSLDPPSLAAEAKDLTVSMLHLEIGNKCVLTTAGEAYCWSSSATPPRASAKA